MNCDIARRRLLAGEHPDRPTDDVRRHLDACASCRAWGRRLALVERQIPRLPVPASSAQAVFVRRFLRTGGPVVRRVPLPWTTPPRQRGLQKLSLAVALAAVLAVFTLGWWTWPHVPAPAPHREPAWIVQIHKERDGIRVLVEPGERVERLTALALKLRGQARTLTRDGDAEDLGRLARVYRELIGGDLMDHARAVPAAQRAIELAGARRELSDAESEFRRAANDAFRSGASTADSLQELADAARDGQRNLQALLSAA
jgi:hypothetical protein